MGRTGAQHGRQSLRLRAVASFLFALLFCLQLAPLAQAQAATTPDCCMAADGKGCSMHLHRAAEAQRSAHTFAAVQPQCPCTPMAPASAASQDALSLSASDLYFALGEERAVSVQPRGLHGVLAWDSGVPRGPPALTLAA